MKLTTNIVLKGNHGRTQSYIVQLTPKTSYIGNFMFDRYAGPSSDHADVWGEHINGHLTKYENDWYEVNENGVEYQLHKANVRLYFPQYSVDIFDGGSTYILSLSTYIHGVEVRLGDFKVERRNALACAPVRFDGMDEYYEYMDFEIADPYSIHYLEEAAGIRAALGDMDDGIGNCSILYVCLSPVEETENGYILRNDWSSGQNSLMLDDYNDLKLELSYSVDDRDLILKLNYNKDTATDIVDYFKKTYNCEDVSAIFQYVVVGKEDIYYEQSYTTELINLLEDGTYRFNIDLPDNDNFFKSWDNWFDGLVLKSSVTFFQTSKIDDFFMSIFSNKLLLTQELFSKMIQSTGYDMFPTKIDLDSLDMNNINLTAINKIVKNVTVVTPTDSTKSHLIQPVFYQTRELAKIVVHPSVTENIALNLDSYKSQVERFKLQIEGIVFNEIGRTGKGIIFKIYGNMLPKTSDEGVMYVLNQDNELVTTGKYSYVY